MAQVSETDLVRSFKDCDLYYSTDGSIFTECSGYAASVAVSGGERATGDLNTLDGDTTLGGIGKRAMYELTFNIVYTENLAHPYGVLLGYHRNATGCYFRWAPKGSTAGNWQWTTTIGFITACPPPAGEASAGDPIAVEVAFRCSDINKTNIAS